MSYYGIPNSANGVAALDDNGELAPTLLADGIDATKLADGSVDNAELETLDGVTVNIQTQLNNTVKLTGDQSIAGVKTFTDGIVGTLSGTATSIAGGGVNKLLLQTGSGTTGFVNEPTTASTYVSYNGTSIGWSTPIATQFEVDNGYSNILAPSVGQMKIYNSKNKFMPTIWGVPQANFVATSTWTARTSTADISWDGLCWSPELGLFCAVSSTGAGNRVMTSPDGITWTAQVSAADNDWRSVCWSSELGLFCAVSTTGAGNRVMTSSDGITWTAQVSAADNDWRSVCWSSELGLFCAVSTTGAGNRVMTSSDGITWTAQVSAADNAWLSVCWSPELGLFCAVSSTGAGNRVMTSPDGITWTAQVSAADNDWLSVCWSPELGLFCAVAVSGTGNRVMTSSDGITWTAQVSAADNAWLSVCWSPELGLFCAVAISGTGNRVMTSPDGITWTLQASAADNNWFAVSWSPELGLFCAVASTGAGNRVQTSASAWSLILNGNQTITGVKTFTNGTIGKWSSNPPNAIASNVIDCSLGNIFAKTLTANTTFSFTNFTASQTIMLTVVNSASNYTISFANVYWQNGVVPTQTTGASIDIWQFFYDGSKVYGALMPNWILV